MLTQVAPWDQHGLGTNKRNERKVLFKSFKLGGVGGVQHNLAVFRRDVLKELLGAGSEHMLAEFVGCGARYTVLLS